MSAIFLWTAQDHTPAAGRKREPLRTSASFWCEVFAALLLGLAFAGPRACGAGEAVHFVAVLDASASMGAEGRDKGLAEKARELVAERIADLPRGSRVTLVQSGLRPRVLAGPAAFMGEAIESLSKYEPSMSRHDLSPAVSMALQLAGEGALLLLTDHFQPERWPAEIEVVSIGEALNNLAIVSATRKRVQTETGEVRERIGLTLANHTISGRTVSLTLAAEGTVFETRKIELACDAREHLSFLIPPTQLAIEARIAGSDALAIDDVAWLAPVPPRTLAIASDLDDGLAGWMGLSAAGEEGGIGRWTNLLPDSMEIDDPNLAHLVITDKAPRAGQTWTLQLRRGGEQRSNLIAPFLVDTQHPLVEGVTLEGIVWSADLSLELRGAPIVSAGNRVLLSEYIEGGRHVFEMNMDPARSSMHRSPDWPILLANVAEMRRAELPGPRRTNLTIGEDFEFHGRKPATYHFEGPGLARDIPAQEVLLVEGVTKPGLYRLSIEGRELCQVGYSFSDSQESDLSGMQSGDRAGTRDVTTVLAGFTWLEMLLIAGALALLLLDWFVLARGAQARAPAQSGRRTDLLEGMN